MPFREFIDKSSGMLTVFGILNALAVFSSTLKEQDNVASYVLSFCFWLMGIVVWFQFFTFASEADGVRKTSVPIAILKISSLLVLVMFAGYMFRAYPHAVAITVGIAIFFASFSLVAWGILKLLPDKLRKWIAKRSETVRHIVILVYACLSIFVAAKATEYATVPVYTIFKNLLLSWDQIPAK